MKKLFTLILAMAGMVGTVSADDFLKGSWDSWTSYTQFTYIDGTGTLSLNLEANTSYEFKFVNVSQDMGNGGTMYFNNCTGWSFSNSEVSNCTLVTTCAGSYTFTVTWGNNSTPYISVTYPSTNDDVVYFCNTVNWSQPYAYILHGSYWDNTYGSGCKNHPSSIAMTNISGSNVWKAEFPSEAKTSYIAFTKEGQNGFEHFYDTEAAYRNDLPSTGTYVYVPETAASGTYNNFNGTSVPYYNNGEWHSYPTYTRTVTSGNFGTICLPFDATVEGATVFKITSKVLDGSNNLAAINLESVESLEAGKAYIFKATGSTLTATYSGSYAAAAEADGMMGNLSSTNVTLDGSGERYVVSDNKIRKVITGGSGVTVGQYRAYITLTGIDKATSRSANFLSFADESTAIESVQTEQNGSNAIYNLQGQRVKEGQKGLFIVGGKKLLMK